VQGLNASVCQLPYMGEKFAMSIILPLKGVHLSEVEQRLDHNLLKEAFEKKKCDKKVKLQLPKFQFESQVEVWVFFVFLNRNGVGWNLNFIFSFLKALCRFDCDDEGLGAV
jgi:hypothetical protein